MSHEYRNLGDLEPHQLAKVDQTIAWTNSNLDRAVEAVAKHLTEHAEHPELGPCALPCIGPVALWYDQLDESDVQKLLIGATRRLAQAKIERGES